jgi:hypothetical protein
MMAASIENPNATRQDRASKRRGKVSQEQRQRKKKKTTKKKNHHHKNKKDFFFESHKLKYENGVTN